MPEAFLAVTIAGALFTLNAYRPLARGGPLSVLSFFAGWITSELPVHHVAWQLVATLAFVAFGALGDWPGWLALGINVASWAGLAYLFAEAGRAHEIVDRALVNALGEGYRDRILPELAGRTDGPGPHQLLARPFRIRHPEVEVTRNVRYSDHGRRGLLDVYRHRDEPAGSPVLLQVHGGAWVTGNKNQQGVPLMTHLAALGWVCVAVNYRLGPKATWPDQIVDVKRAIAWVKEHAGEYGGNPDFIVVSGGSAGGHLSALAALTPNDPAFQPGFEDRDTTVQACVPFYGVYDFTNRDGNGRGDMRLFLERMVMKRKLSRDRDVFEAASPMSRIHPAVPPFFVIHGTNDTLVPARQARVFVELLREASHAPVAYAELPGAQHAFEIFTSRRTVHVVDAVERFVALVYSDYLRARGEEEEVEAVP